MRGLTIQKRVFYEWKQKILEGHLPVIPRPRFLHHGFRQPLPLCMRKKMSKSLFLPELEPFQKFTIPLENLQFHWSMYPYERGLVSNVVCHLFVVQVPERSAVCSQALWVVSGEASANFERPSRTESFLFGFSPTSHPRLANNKAFVTVYLFFKIGHN